MNTATVVLVRYVVVADKVGAALDGIRKLVATVIRDEPACGGIELLLGVDSSQILLIERWPSREHFLGPHMQEPHIQAFIQSASELFAGPPEITFWSPSASG